MEYDLNVSIVSLESMQAVSIRDHCPAAELSKKYAEIYGELGGMMKKQSLGFASHPFGIYHNFSPGDVDVEAGIPVSGSPVSEGRAVVMKTYSGKAVKIDFFGHYSKLSAGWDVLSKYLKDNGLKPAAPCFEIYVSDPEKEPDPDKWLTEIYCPV